jgi:filamentous hemagglutinin family protein
VTGGNLSNISGTLGTFQQLPNGQFATAVPNVNLFLINPNSIIFGSGARLDVGASFVATTANAFQFGNLGTFSASQPTPPDQLLTINPSAFLYNQLAQQPRNSIESRAFLRVPDGQSLVLLGGNIAPTTAATGEVFLTGFGVVAPGGQVEVGSVGSSGDVDLVVADRQIGFRIPTTMLRSDITLTGGVSVGGATSRGNRDMRINGRNITLNQRSFIGAGITAGAGNSSETQAGNVIILASGNLRVSEGSRISSIVDPFAAGQTGNVTIEATNLFVEGGSSINPVLSGRGLAGNVTVKANAIALDNAGQIVSAIAPLGSGASGNVSVETGTLSITNGAGISASAFGAGLAGDVQVSASQMLLDGVGIISNGLSPSGIFSTFGATQAEGRGGNVTVRATSLTVANGATISASTIGRGNAGNVEVTAENQLVLDAGGIAGEVGSTATGNSGNVTVRAGALTASRVGVISSTTFGQGSVGNVQVTADQITLDGNVVNGRTSGIFSAVERTGIGAGGNVVVRSDSLQLTNGAAISASTFGTGNAGNVQVSAANIIVDGTNPGGAFATAIASGVAPGAVGNGGSVAIDADSLTVRNGANISASTFGQGNAGNLDITSDTILLDGRSANDRAASGIASQVNLGATGSGGTVRINTNSLAITDGAAVSVATGGIGNAGSIFISADNITLADGPFGVAPSGISSLVARTATGDGGDIKITTRSLTLANGALISSNAGGQGNAGNLDITTNILQLDNGGIIAGARSGNGANITLNIGELLLMRRGSDISTSAGLAGAGGDGGNITINAPNGFIVGVKSENSDIRANAFTGSGGRVNITAQGIYGLQFRPRLTEFSDITASSTFGVSGVVAINTLGIDPSRGLRQLPGGFVDPSNRIDQKCAAGSGFRQSSFTVTGRGGLPENPLEPLQSGEGIAEWVEVEAEREIQNISYGNAARTKFKIQNSEAPPPIIEVDSVMVNKDGSVELVASQQMAQPGRFWYLPSCASWKD